MIGNDPDGHCQSGCGDSFRSPTSRLLTQPSPLEVENAGCGATPPLARSFDDLHPREVLSAGNGTYY
ncbi:hypothetical protein MRX96_017179 [Rhipicephalus microplus]